MPASPSRNGSAPGRVTYAEVRRMARWLGVFTPRDLAGALRADEAVGERFVTALCWQGICLATGDEVEGPTGPELVYEMEPLPDRVYPRIKRMPPEIKAVIETGGFLLYNPRGLPVRTSDSDRRRQQMSQPGIRKRIKDSERAYKRMEDAKTNRAKKDRARARARAEGKDLKEVLAEHG